MKQIGIEQIYTPLFYVSRPLEWVRSKCKYNWQEVAIMSPALTLLFLCFAVISLSLPFFGLYNAVIWLSRKTDDFEG